jgi:cellulose synthase/poly-beta-1,6-N-acetylglucosamine synthase-like glycosyltransferase
MIVVPFQVPWMIIWLAGLMVVMLVLPPMIALSLLILLVGVVGVIAGRFLLAHHRARIREELLFDVRLMLSDTIRNNLSIISMHCNRLEPNYAARTMAAIERVTKIIDTLSEEELALWQAKYDNVVQDARQLLDDKS